MTVTAEWRLLRGWSDVELAARLTAIEYLPRSFREAQDQMTPGRGWNRHGSQALVGSEGAGLPVPGGSFERAREAVTAYLFSDPRIVTAHFDAGAPLLGRRMLLELKVLGLRYLCGVVVGAVRWESNPTYSLFGFRYDTLEGHIESGSEWFLLTKEHQSGEVRFRIQAAWRPGRFPNWWSRLGFLLVGRRRQRAWHRLAYLRLRNLLGASGLPALPRPGQLVHQGPALPSPRLGRVSRKPHLGRAPRFAAEEERDMRPSTIDWAIPAGLSALSGMRSLTPPALVSRAGSRVLRRGEQGLSRRSLRASRVLTLLAWGELLADKTPWIPARVRPLPLGGRALSGALVAAAVAPRRGRAALLAALAGALSAVGAAFTAFRLRRLAGRKLGVPDVVLGLLEDGLVFAGSTALLRRWEARVYPNSSPGYPSTSRPRPRD